MNKTTAIEQKNALAFSHLLDDMIARGAPPDQPALENSALRQDLVFAALLANQTIPGETLALQRIQQRLFQKDVRPAEENNDRPLPQLRIRPVMLRPVLILIVFILVLSAAAVLHPPLSVRAQEWLGFGYFPKAGIIRLEGASVLSTPLTYELNGRTLTIEQAINTEEDGLELWLTYQGWEDPPHTPAITAGPLKQSWDGWWDEDLSRVSAYWRYADGWDYPSPITLVFGEGFQAQLALIPASEAVQASSGRVAGSETSVCDSIQGVEICTLGHVVEGDTTHILLSIRSLDPALEEWTPFLPAAARVTLLNREGEAVPALPAPLEQVYSRPQNGIFILQASFPLVLEAHAQSRLSIERLGFVGGGEGQVLSFPLPDRDLLLEGVAIDERLSIGGIIPLRMTRVQLFPSYADRWTIQFNLEQVEETEPIRLDYFTVDPPHPGGPPFECGVVIDGNEENFFMIQVRVTDDVLKEMEAAGAVQLHLNTAMIEVMGPFILGTP